MRAPIPINTTHNSQRESCFSDSLAWNFISRLSCPADVELRRMALARERWWSGEPSARAGALSHLYSAPRACAGRHRPGLAFARSAGAWQERRTDVAYRPGQGNPTDAAVWTAGYPSSGTV